MKYRIPKPSLTTVAIVWTLVLVVGWLLIGPPAIWRNPPLYPAARQVQVEDYGKGRWEQHDGGVFVLKRTIFTTSDSPEQVWAFYERNLATPDKLGPPYATSKYGDQVWHTWIIHVLLPWPDTYTLHVTMEPLNDRGTRVELLVGMDPF